MQPNIKQLAFLADLRRGPYPAAMHLDACVVGPLIRANLVQWEDEPRHAARSRRPQASTFALTSLGEGLLAEHEAGAHAATIGG